jgi:Nitrogen Permease regulator of amino acid transport activity 3.
MSMANDLTLDEVLLYAAHLVNWQAGKVINVISKESVYGINPKMDKEFLREKLLTKFRKKFKNDLPQILNGFSTPAPIAKVKEKLKLDSNVMFSLIAWFLKYSYLIEYNYYVFMSCPEPEFKIKIKNMKASNDEKKRKMAEILEKLAAYSFKRISVGEIAFEQDIAREKIFKVLFNNKGLIDYYYTE